MLLLICKCSKHGKEGNLLGGSYVPPPEAKYDQLEQCFLESPALGLSHPHGAVDWKGVRGTCISPSLVVGQQDPGLTRVVVSGQGFCVLSQVQGT